MLRDARLRRMPSAVGSKGLLGHTFRRSWIRPLARAAMISVLVVLVALGAAIVVLLSGPTEIGILRGRVEQTVARALGDGYSVSVGRTTVDIDPTLGLVVLVDDVSVADASNNRVAFVPSTRLAVDALALLTFRGVIRSVELNAPEVTFTRQTDGKVVLGRGSPDKAAPAPAPAPAAARPPAEATAAGANVAAARATATGVSGGFPDLLAALQILDHGIEPSIQTAIRAGFERFSMVQASIDIIDAGYAEERKLPRTDLSVSVNPVTADVTVNLTGAGYSGRWSATAERTVDPSTGERLLKADFSQLTLADLFPRFAEVDPPMSSDVPFYGQVNVRLGQQGDVREATARLDLGAGTFEFRGARDNILLDEATIKLRWDIANNAVIVEPSTYYLGQTRGVVTGTIRPDGDPMLRRYAFNLESRGTVLAARDANAPPLPIQRMTVNGTVDLPAKFLNIQNATVSAAAGSVSGSGSIDFNGPSPSVVAAASLTPMPVEVAKQLWPVFIAGGARRWVLDHVSNGRVASGRFEAAVPHGILWTGQRVQIPEDAMRLDFRLENITFTTLGDLPPIVNAYGNAALAGSTFGIDIEKGQVVTPSGRKVEVTAGAFAVPNMVPVIPDARVELQMAGDVAALGEVADSAPFNALKRQKLTPQALSGNGTANLSARWPMRPALTEADVDWRVSVSVGNFASTQPVAGRLISDGKVNLTVTPDDVTIIGRAKIDGVFADVNMTQPIGEQKELGPGKRQIRLTLDEADRKKLGMGLNDIIGGTIDAVVTDAQAGKPQHYEIDLRRARLTLATLGWSKGVGVAGKLAFDLLTQPDGGYKVDNIRLTGDGFGLSGRAVLDSKYGLVSADISEFALRKGDDIAFSLKRERNGYVATATGKSFDLRGLMQGMKRATTKNGTAPDLTLDAKVEKLIGFNNETLSKADISIAAAAGSLKKLDIKGTLGNSQLVASYAETPQEGRSLLTTSDAGALLRFIDLYQRVAGGDLRLEGRRVGANEPQVGTFQVTNFRVVGEPFMARVASNANDQGINYNSVPFEAMQLNFTARNQLVVIDDAVLKGAQIGVTLDGRLDFNNGAMLLQGTYLPAYALNNIFGRIPIIGLIAGGGSKGGLFGITFRVEGAMDDPAVKINPLSAIAPGITRKFLEFHDSGR
jgi:hypothetical protein